MIAKKSIEIFLNYYSADLEHEFKKILITKEIKRSELNSLIKYLSKYTKKNLPNNEQLIISRLTSWWRYYTDPTCPLNIKYRFLKNFNILNVVEVFRYANLNKNYIFSNELPSKIHLKKNTKKFISYNKSVISFMQSHIEFTERVDKLVDWDKVEFLGPIGFMFYYLNLYIEEGNQIFSPKRDKGWGYFKKLVDILQEDLRVHLVIKNQLTIKTYSKGHNALKKTYKKGSEQIFFYLNVIEEALKLDIHLDIKKIGFHAINLIFFLGSKYQGRQRKEMIYILDTMATVNKVLNKNKSLSNYSITKIAMKICKTISEANGDISPIYDDDEIVRRLITFAKKVKIFQ